MNKQKKIIRVVTAQGVCQLVNAISVLKYHNSFLDNPELDSLEDYLIIGGFYIIGDQFKHKTLLNECIEISRLWNFKKTIELDDKLLSKPENINIIKDILLNQIGQECDIIYVCRNGQPFNQILLQIYKNAKKICCGDGFGVLDLGKFIDTRYECSRISESILFLPLVCSSALEYTDRVLYPNINYLISTLKELSNQKVINYQKYIKNLEKEIKKFDHSVMVTTSNLTEAGCIKSNFIMTVLASILKISTQVDKRNVFCQVKLTKRILTKITKVTREYLARNEVNMYFSHVIRGIKNGEYPENTIFIVKPHPRESFDQSKYLCKKLRNYGYNSICIDSCLGSTLSEVFLFFDFIERYECLGSSSAFIIGYLKGKSTVKYLIDYEVAKKFLKKEYLDKVYSSDMLEVLSYYFDLT